MEGGDPLKGQDYMGVGPLNGGLFKLGVRLIFKWGLAL